jgi:GNAT superfamily N-acetyltransferase
MDEPIVRRARAVDIDAVVELRAEMFEAMGIAAGDAAWRDHARVWFEARIDDPRYCVAVVEVGGAVVSCALGSLRDAAPSPHAPEGGDVLVSNVCTLPAARGQGYARAALEHVMRWARSTGSRRAELFATAAGRGMYTAVGFTETQQSAMRARLRESG